ncbi:unannotated protein [freshwater metagenome]|uniref:Unannotated protein n=1 Tax=freshwater metagenome TaxID=449393 RepID=A0A6J7CP72_9ZZZZ
MFRRIATVHGALDIAHRSGDDTMFVVSRDGFVAAVRNATVADGHVLDISSIIVSGNEQGLLGMAFAADGEHAYVDYTDRDGNTVIAEFAVGSNGTFDPASRRELLTINQPYPNHNGGAIRFGPDGLLYIGMGDGGSGGDPDRRALDTGDLLGKILRIDPTPSAGRPYTIPADNPFINVPGARPEIWSIGLRNPWRFNFDRTNGDLWIADVGQDQWEEIDVATASTGAGRGANFGWSAFEGTHRFNEDQPADGVTMPIFEYPHGSAGCSIAGGVRYRGSAIPSLVGWYVFGDYCSGRVQALQVNADNTAGRVVDLGADVAGLAGISQAPNGELYVLSVETGNVFAVQPVS